MAAALCHSLARNFGALLDKRWPSFANLVIEEVLHMTSSGDTVPQPKVETADHLYMYHNHSSDFCSCLFANERGSVRVSAVSISRFVQHMSRTTSDAQSNLVCVKCRMRFLPKHRIFIYDDVQFRRSLMSRIFTPTGLSGTTLDLPRVDDDLEATHLPYVYFFACNAKDLLQRMSGEQLDMAWRAVKLHLEPLQTLKLVGASRFTSGNLKWPIMCAHQDDRRCTCIATSIEECCNRFAFDGNVRAEIAKLQPWRHGLYFLSLGKAIHHLVFHTKPIDIAESLSHRRCIICSQVVHVDDICSPNINMLTSARTNVSEDDPMVVDCPVDTEAGVEDRSPTIISKTDSSAVARKRSRDVDEDVASASEPVFKKAKTGANLVKRPRISTRGKLPKATAEIVEAMFSMAFEDDILRKNLDQWLPWLARSDCQPADRIFEDVWSGTNLSTEIAANDGFVRMNSATELSSLVIYIPRPTAEELNREYAAVLEQATQYKSNVKRGTTRIFCRNVQVIFPFNFDFARVFISSSRPKGIVPALDKFVTEPSGGYCSLLIGASMGATEIVIEPLVLSRFDDEDEQVALRSNDSESDLSHNIQIIPIQDNLEISSGTNISRPNTDIVVVTPHPFKFCYPPPRTALFARGAVRVGKNTMVQRGGYGIAPISFERLAADLGLVAPSVPRPDNSVPLNSNGSIIETYSRDEQDHRVRHERRLRAPLGHLKNPLQFVPTPDLTDMLFWPPSSGFVIRFDANVVKGRSRKKQVGVGADGIIKRDGQQIEIQPCPMYKDPKTGAVVVTYEGRWLLNFVPDDHSDGSPIVSYTVSTNRYFWDKDRTPVNSSADFAIAGGPCVSFFNADEELEELRTCIDPTRPVGEQLRNMERIASHKSSAVVQTPQLRDHYSIVRIYTRSFQTMLDVNFVRICNQVCSKEAIATRHFDLYWRATIPSSQLYNENGEVVPDAEISPEDAEVMMVARLDQAGVRLIVRKAGFYSVSQILDAPVFMAAEQQVDPHVVGRSLFANDSPMVIPAFVEHGKVHLACNSLESSSRLDQFEKFQIDRRNMMQMVLASTIAKRVIEHPELPFQPIQNRAALVYTNVAHNSTNIHRYYPWIAGIFPWLTFDLNMPLNIDVLQQQHVEREKKREEMEMNAATQTKKKSRSVRKKYNTCLFCRMLTVPITTKRKPSRHSPHMCPVFFEYSNSERALLNFALTQESKLNPNFKDKLLRQADPDKPSVKGYRLNVELFKNTRNKLRMNFVSRLNSLIKCESNMLGPIYAEELKIKYSTVCLPKRLPWVTLLTSFCGDSLMDAILGNGTGAGFPPASKDEIIPLEKEPSSSTPHIAPTSELREIFCAVHQKLEDRLRAKEVALVSDSSSSLSSSSE